MSQRGIEAGSLVLSQALLKFWLTVTAPRRLDKYSCTNSTTTAWILSSQNFAAQQTQQWVIISTTLSKFAATILTYTMSTWYNLCRIRVGEGGGRGSITFFQRSLMDDSWSKSPTMIPPPPFLLPTPPYLKSCVTCSWPIPNCSIPWKIDLIHHR